MAVPSVVSGVSHFPWKMVGLTSAVSASHTSRKANRRVTPRGCQSAWRDGTLFDESLSMEALGWRCGGRRDTGGDVDLTVQSARDANDAGYFHPRVSRDARPNRLGRSRWWAGLRALRPACVCEPPFGPVQTP